MKKLIGQLADVLEEIAEERKARALQPVSELRKGAVSADAQKPAVEERTIADGFIRRLRPKISSTAEFDAAVEKWLRGNPEHLRGALLSNIGSGEDAKRVFEVIEKHMRESH